MTTQAVLNQKSRPRKGRYTQQGALFANHILTLGKDGFAGWLLRSFGGKEPTNEPGWFHYDDAMLFNEAFALVVDEFEDDVLSVAEASVEEVLATLNHEQVGYVGLYIVTALAEQLKIFSSVEKLSIILDQRVPRGNQRGSPPGTRDDAVALRETLECVYRLLLIPIYDFYGSGISPSSITPDHLKEFCNLCSWSDFILRHRHNDRVLLPARAPIYFFALTHANLFQKTEQPDPYDIRLWGGSFVRGDQFEDLFEFSSRRSPDDKFPYNIDRILDERSNFIRALTRGPDAGRGIVAYDDPFDATVSATRGSFPTKVDPDEYFTAMRSLDDEPIEEAA